ncbi:benzoate/H(+) symporter BenE family transporter [Xanthomonas campestris pv. campestris]|uniref:benzoate/H(+) symporter BenE family transporter n=1 Tax=Xanthomonas campestris TaxID=339 RepID=UPI002269A7CD|nr:benzoate/H(+) symporter BenE family transporter [Xanthomonas campestris]MDO0790848.1 benzoate/H(+) symporter BenE family transporter [Xanthomonas campestris pv. campestris]MDO0839307.1 benzoate/H(+) symporter BenE family transporter [Xanthomonas campestris pv. campestris]MEB1349281.1 benzoate/H(+) symporter BenE family transporter [Xanthomonas campestris pv. campestris]WDK49703.1 benzoate/H(+) symporter BenE family transporter [Xanthomonas campestris pv. campestris]WDK54041.1 benzoate/H(+) 
MSSARSLFRDLSLPAIAAGFVTVLVGFASSAVIVFEAARHLGADQAEIASWMWALGIGMGVTCIGLSLRYRVPVVTAWSTPGAALLIGTAAGVPLREAIGAFVVAAVLGAIAGFTGLFERAIRRIPLSLASGMLAGVLLRFGLDLFVAMQSQAAMALSMLATYLIGRRWFTRYAVIATLLVGIAIAAGGGLMHWNAVRLEMARPVLMVPGLSWAALFGLAIPLFVVTMASQNVPGVAVMRASGYTVPISPTIGWIGVVNTVLAPFGGYALNLAAITAAICMGREAHEDPARRYPAAVAAGVFYIVIGLFGATVAAVFAAFPRELVMAIAGIALLGTIGNSLAAALREEPEREAALITFLVTASGLTLGGIGASFWGLLAGAITLIALRPRRPQH